MEIRELTKAYLQANHLSASFLAEKIGTCKDTVWRWLHGYPLSQRNLEKIKRFLDGDWITTADDIIRENEEKTLNEHFDNQ